MRKLIKIGKNIEGGSILLKLFIHILRIAATTAKLANKATTQSTLSTLPTITVDVFRKAVIEFMGAPPLSTKYYTNKH